MQEVVIDVFPVPFGQETDWVCLGCHPEMVVGEKMAPLHFGRFGGLGRFTAIYVNGQLHTRALEAMAGSDGWVVESPEPPDPIVNRGRARCSLSGNGHGWPVRRRRTDVEIRIH